MGSVCTKDEKKHKINDSKNKSKNKQRRQTNGRSHKELSLKGSIREECTKINLDQTSKIPKEIQEERKLEIKFPGEFILL